MQIARGELYLPLSALTNTLPEGYLMSETHVCFVPRQKAAHWLRMLALVAGSS